MLGLPTVTTPLGAAGRLLSPRCARRCLQNTGPRRQDKLAAHLDFSKLSAIEPRSLCTATSELHFCACARNSTCPRVGPVSPPPLCVHSVQEYHPNIRMRLQAAAVQPASANTRDMSSALSLANIRSSLIRQEDTIIFSFIERAQFCRNLPVYTPDAIPVPGRWPGAAPGLRRLPCCNSPPCKRPGFQGPQANALCISIYA